MKIKDLVGYTVKRIFMNENALKFETDKGSYVFTVEGDCCSSSYFYDFTGADKLLNHEIKKVEEVELGTGGKHEEGHDILECYGYRFITEDPQFGEVSSVMSFRNDSNGYYGGYITGGNKSNEEVLPEITNDYYCTNV